MSDTKFGTFDDLIAITAPAQRPTLNRLRALIQVIDPAAYEVVRLGDRAATYGIGPKKNTEGYAYLLPHESCVNLGFFQGTALPDPAGVMEGTGAKMRHVKIRSLADAERPLIEALIRAAIAERKQALGR